MRRAQIYTQANSSAFATLRDITPGFLTYVMSYLYREERGSGPAVRVPDPWIFASNSLVATHQGSHSTSPSKPTLPFPCAMPPGDMRARTESKKKSTKGSHGSSCRSQSMAASCVVLGEPRGCTACAPVLWIPRDVETRRNCRGCNPPRSSRIGCTVACGTGSLPST
jgi:hypothetical protein